MDLVFVLCGADNLAVFTLHRGIAHYFVAPYHPLPSIVKRVVEVLMCPVENYLIRQAIQLAIHSTAGV